jgi:hypothetical protein
LNFHLPWCFTSCKLSVWCGVYPPWM